MARVDLPASIRWRSPLEVWAYAQHRACHRHPVYVTWLPDRDAQLVRCSGCPWRMTVSRVQVVRWFGNLRLIGRPDGEGT